MKRKLRVAILFGGRSAEHEVSLQSTRNIVAAIDKKKYDVVLVGIDKEGKWHLNDAGGYLLNNDNPKLIRLNNSPKYIVLTPGSTSYELVTMPDNRSIGPVDVVFPVLHGPYGEDGSVQGLLKLAGVPFVGAGVLGSAVGMDKDVMKRLLRDAGIATARFRVFGSQRKPAARFAELSEELGVPLFVKPANLGSSVGISKVVDAEGLARAIDEALRYDRKVLIEECIDGREMEVAVLGNEEPQASLPGEVVANRSCHQFYSYEAKYIDEGGAALKVPAEVAPDVAQRLQALAVRVFRTLCCEGMARVDMFMRGDGALVVNEVNTIPGFTNSSMYPRLWEASGVPLAELIDRLIRFALQRHEQERRLRTSVAL